MTRKGRRKMVSDRTHAQLARAAAAFRRASAHAEEPAHREELALKACWLGALRADLEARPPRCS